LLFALPSYPLDQLSRYEAILWRQAGQILFALDALYNVPTAGESGVAALVLLLRFHGIAADSEQMRHHFGTEIGVQEMLRCAKAFGLKARA